MDEKYFAKKIEAKWQKKWADSRSFEVSADSERSKFYQLEMLPYPSGNLHMGHVRNYSVGDAVAWFKRLKGFNVLHPIGWDSFGQPAEDAAVKRGVNPREWTEANILAMQGQLERIGLSYDWSRQMAAHRPEYYRWDQWFFLKMYQMGLAYKKKTQVNWCEHDQATLSNEQASGGLCWRCGNPVTKKDLEQWFLRTTHYADQLVDDLEKIESGWPAHVIKRQRDWIGRSKGAYVDFKVKAPGATDQPSPGIAGDHSVRVFTTRIDTIYGTNAIVVAPEHPLLESFRPAIADDVLVQIEGIAEAKKKTSDREGEVPKNGVDTGLKAVNPFNEEELPVWVGNYVMMEYGTGALMSVPAHDERDFEFAKKYNLPIRQVISEPDLVHEHHTMQALALERPVTEPGVLVHSDYWNGKPSADAKHEMSEWAEKNGFGESATTYRLRDWGISRQRFWGAPIPIVYCEQCGIVPEKEENLPILLPDNAPITGTGESPLARVPEFFETECPNCGSGAHRETDTMDTFVDSSWYFFRYLDPQNDQMPFEPEKAAYWTPVDQYIGGDDHAVMHLIYARFWTKAMRDMGLVNFDEPITRLLTQGMVVGETFFDESTGKRAYVSPTEVTTERDAKGKIIAAFADGTELKYAIERMSKSKGNGVDPDEMVDIYGADATRLFILFAAPVDNELVWHEAGIEGAVRFLQRIWRFVHKWEGQFTDAAIEVDISGSDAARKLRQKTHQTIKRVGDALDTLQFNTPVAALMEFTNSIYDSAIEPATATPQERAAISEAVLSLITMLAPFAPHIAEELYSEVTGKSEGMIASGAIFPTYRSDAAAADEIEIAVQVNGKLRSRVFADAAASDSELERLALSDEKVRDHIDGKSVAKVIVIPKRLVNIVVKG